jgi:regulator of replication initiation timing
MTATEALERRIDELCRENEQMRQYNNTLREQVDTAKHNSVRNAREYARLCRVNDKLRELVRDMWRELAVACAEQVTSHETLREVSDRMRELGIEVDG